MNLFSMKTFLLLVFSFAHLQAFEPPEATSFSQDYYGVTIKDPYRYFETPNEPRVEKWAREVATQTDQYLSQLPLRQKIQTLLQEADAQKDYSIHYIYRAKEGVLFMKAQGPNDNVPKLYRKYPHQEPHIFLDPKSLLESPDPVSLKNFSLSPDERYLAVHLASGGSEKSSLYLLELKTKKLIEKPITRTRWGAAHWLPDSTGFFYSRLQKLGPDSDPLETFQRSKIWLHKLGQPIEEDTAILGIGVNPSIEVAPADLPFINTLPDSDWVISYNSTGVSDDHIFHLARLQDVIEGKANWLPISTRQDLVSDLVIHGDHLYLHSQFEAPNGKIIRTSLSNPQLETAELIYAPKSGSIDSIAWAKEGIYVKVLDGGPSRLVRLPFESPSQAEKIITPENSSLGFQSYMGSGSNQSGVYLSAGSWVSPTQHHLVAPAEAQSQLLSLFPKTSSSIPKDLVSKQIWVTSHDGVKVPVSLIHRKGLVLDGSHPVMLYAYGSYGTTIQPRFRDSDMALYEMGGIKAIAHVRGGGALGQSWHLAGKKETKPNTWKDLIATARELVALNYSKPEKICISGASAGGITVGRAITEAPQDFGAALIGVGVCDAIRKENTPNGIPNIPEFGTCKIEAEFHALHAMSAYHHVKEDTSYPATMLYHGANDTRVVLWQSLKMAARLMAAQKSESPILMRIDYQAGHGRGTSTKQRIALDADQLAFFFEHCGQESQR